MTMPLLVVDNAIDAITILQLPSFDSIFVTFGHDKIYVMTTIYYPNVLLPPLELAN